jgi:hypothetical protein
MNLDQFQLGLLVAACSLLLLAILGGGVAAAALWAWFRSHSSGSSSWDNESFRLIVQRDIVAQQAQIIQAQEALGTAYKGTEE